MKRLALICGMAALVALVACSKAPTPVTPKVDSGPGCASYKDCEAGEVCDTATAQCGACKSSGQCLPHQDCASPSANQSLRCTFQAGWGNDCTLNADCPAAKLCKQGLCVASTDVVACPSYVCAAGQRCNRVNLVCEIDSGCFTDEQCDPSQVCNLATNRCDLRCTDANAQTVCLAGQKCVAGRCAQCGADADCQGGLKCDVTAGICTAGSTCFSDRDCTVPLVCNPLTLQCTQTVPPCVSDEQCRADQSCDVPSGRCVASGCQPDRYEPNHSQAAAAAIGPGPEIDVTGLTLCNGDSDYFSFSLLQGDLVQAVVDADTLAATTFEATLLDPLGRAIARGDLVASGQADSDGTYALRVRSSDLSQRYGLRVTIDHTSASCQNDAYEPNDTVPQATPLRPPGLSTLAICGGDHDWYSVQVASGRALRALLESDATGGEVDLYAYAADATTPLGALADGTHSGELVVQPVSDAGATYYLLVQGGEARSTNQYSLSVSFPTAAPYVPDAGPADAGPLDGGFETDGGDVDGGVAVDGGDVDGGTR
jgi:hypothetical protein